MTAHGLLLAAGAGARMGGPKALVTDDDGTSWLLRAVGALTDAGCPSVTVVLGAAAEEALPLLADSGAHAVVAGDWREGMGASLRAGLEALGTSPADAVVVTLVDLPDVGPDVVARLVAGAGPATLRRATYDGRPGHPVVLGRDHWEGVTASATGDHGARDYLVAHAVEAVECGDLATGQDVDVR